MYHLDVRTTNAAGWIGGAYRELCISRSVHIIIRRSERTLRIVTAPTRALLLLHQPGPLRVWIDHAAS